MCMLDDYGYGIQGKFVTSFPAFILNEEGEWRVWMKRET